MRTRHAESGLTMIELAVTVAIVAILAAIAVPSLTWAIGRARSNEAVDSLSSIYQLESTYHFENRTYGSLTQVGYVPEGENRYAFCVGNPKTSGNCVASATDEFDFAGAAGKITTKRKEGAPPPLPPTPIPLKPLNPPAPPGAFSAGGNPFIGKDKFEADASGRVSN